MSTRSKILSHPAPSRSLVLRCALRLVRRWHQRHRQRLHLDELSDDHLRDIGLSRRDVERECAKPFWR
ncbi:DUF1127 domain-containing protein [Oryzicola mucosus]|uniref:DUF1127 domain-containing protein n=1 Tax=Oryzicola mucosus TaxID=2767425 RepID=A0A8J6PIQ4_9HYPH|nr:DUF1127 domain-containing protein [Oryzicola mucosus]MBD0414888.1 DUF1127 domain-containing protein [Oryzicola mucosus]